MRGTSSRCSARSGSVTARVIILVPQAAVAERRPASDRDGARPTLTSQVPFGPYTWPVRHADEARLDTGKSSSRATTAIGPWIGRRSAWSLHLLDQSLDVCLPARGELQLFITLARILDVPTCQ